MGLDRLRLHRLDSIKLLARCLPRIAEEVLEASREQDQVRLSNCVAWLRGIYQAIETEVEKIKKGV